MMRRLFFLIFQIAFPYLIHGSDCGCDYTISKNQEEIWYVPSPSPYTHQKYWPLKRAGETIICLEAGLRNRLYIRNFNGGSNNDGSKYVFKNCNGLVEIKAPANNGITFYNCQDFKLSGTGDPQYTYGIRISETRYNGTNYGNAFGIAIEGYSEKAEVEYVEITGTGFSAIAAKTDGGAYYPDKLSKFVLNDLKLHHNYIHDLKKGEGFYIGHNQWNDSAQHRLDGVFIYKNKLENIPWDGIQVGGTKNDTPGIPGNAEVYENIIIGYGTDRQAQDPWQNNGINLSSGFSGKCYNNFIKQTPEISGGNGIITGGVGDVHIFNNVILYPAEAGIYGNLSVKAPAELSRAFYFYNNTIIKPATYGIVYKIPGPTGYFTNNLVGSATGLFLTDRNCVLNVSSNWMEMSDFSNFFLDPGKDDFHLKTSATQAIDSGSDLSVKPFDLTFDYTRSPRPSGSKFDLGAYEFIAK